MPKIILNLIGNKPAVVARPDFIGIGAQKAGTSWLYRRLRELPDIYLPPVKELHYFDNFKNYRVNPLRSEPRLSRRIGNAEWLKSAFFECLLAARDEGLAGLAWQTKYHFSNHTDRWYLSLFDTAQAVKGEITPAYATLQEQDIERMHKLVPDIKIIYIIRNPIERAWSAYRFNSTKLPDLQVDRYLDSQAQERNSDYLGNVARFSKFYSKDKILVAFYDAIVDQPVLLLESIVKWLGGDPERVRSCCNVSEKNKVSTHLAMPADVKRHLQKKYHAQIVKLAEAFGGYAAIWAENSNAGIIPSPTFSFKDSRSII